MFSHVESKCVLCKKNTPHNFSFDCVVLDGRKPTTDVEVETNSDWAKVKYNIMVLPMCDTKISAPHCIISKYITYSSEKHSKYIT